MALSVDSVRRRTHAPGRSWLGGDRHRPPVPIARSRGPTRKGNRSMQQTMRALVKKEARPGLWLEEVPVPTIGINDVLIKVLRTGICGTDVHIYAVGRLGPEDDPRPDGGRPRVRGRDRRGRLERQGLPRRRDRQRRGARRLRPLPQLPGRPPPPLQGHQGDRRQPPRRVRRVPRPADDQRLGPRPEHPPRRAGDLRPVRQRRPHGPAVRRARRGRADHRRRADRRHGREGRPPRRGAARRRHRREPVSPRAREEDGGHAGRRRPRAVDRRASRRSSA